MRKLRETCVGAKPAPGVKPIFAAKRPACVVGRKWRKPPVDLTATAQVWVPTVSVSDPAVAGVSRPRSARRLPRYGSPESAVVIRGLRVTTTAGEVAPAVCAAYEPGVVIWREYAYVPLAAVVTVAKIFQPEPVSTRRSTFWPPAAGVKAPLRVAFAPYVGTAGLTPKVMCVAAEAVP